MFLIGLILKIMGIDIGTGYTRKGYPRKKNYDEDWD